jgi:hypothetical protein
MPLEQSQGRGSRSLPLASMVGVGHPFSCTNKALGWPHPGEMGSRHSLSLGNSEPELGKEEAKKVVAEGPREGH